MIGYTLNVERQITNASIGDIEQIELELLNQEHLLHSLLNTFLEDDARVLFLVSAGYNRIRTKYEYHQNWSHPTPNNIDKQ
jgi:hypothetical protein